jgi:hypothetical protein
MISAHKSNHALFGYHAPHRFSDPDRITITLCSDRPVCSPSGRCSTQSKILKPHTPTPSDLLKQPSIPPPLRPPPRQTPTHLLPTRASAPSQSQRPPPPPDCITLDPTRQRWRQTPAVIDCLCFAPIPCQTALSGPCSRHQASRSPRRPRRRSNTPYLKRE